MSRGLLTHRQGQHCSNKTKIGIHLTFNLRSGSIIITFPHLMFSQLDRRKAVIPKGLTFGRHAKRGSNITLPITVIELNGVSIVIERGQHELTRLSRTLQ
jgi:hypothetical protein